MSPAMSILRAMVLCCVSATVFAADDEVVVTRGTASLNYLDFDAALGALPPEQRALLVSSDNIDRVINDMLLTRQLAQTPEAEAIAKDPLFEREAAQAREKLLSRRVLNARIEAMRKPNFELLAKEKFQASPAEFKQPPNRDVQHILISTVGKDDAAARVKAEALLTQAKAGADYQELVRDNSDDPSKTTNNGLILVMESSQLDPAFKEAALALEKIGDITGPIKSQFGYHLIKLTELREAHEPEFDKVKASIMADLEKTWWQQANQKVLSELQAEPMQFNEEAARKLPERYSEQ